MAEPTEQQMQDITAYLQAAQTCVDKGPTSPECVQTGLLEGAALAAGLDPSVVQAANDCISSGSAEGCAKAGTTLGLTVACTAATSGVATMACGPLASLVVNLAWPAIWGVMSTAADIAGSLVGRALEVVGLKEEPQFSDVADAMWNDVYTQVTTSIDKTIAAVVQAIHDQRVKLGMKDNGTIFFRKPYDCKKAHCDKLWSNHEGQYVWVQVAAEQLIWDRLGNDAGFAAGFSSTSKYGDVGLTQGVMGSDREANIASAYTLACLKPWYSISWGTAWERDDAFKTAGDALARLYQHRLDALREALYWCMVAMSQLESLNPATVEAMQSESPGGLSNAGMKTGSVSGPTSTSWLLWGGLLLALGGGGYAYWRYRKGKPNPLAAVLSPLAKAQLSEITLSPGTSERSRVRFEASRQAMMSDAFEESDARRVLLHVDPDAQPDLRQHLLMAIR